jgi:hypothetical protein
VAIGNGVTAVVLLAWAIASLGAGAEFRVVLATSGILIAILAGAQFVSTRQTGQAKST